MWVAVVCRYYSKITDALVVGWVLALPFCAAAAEVKAPCEGHGRVDQVASVRERQIPPTHV